MATTRATTVATVWRASDLAAVYGVNESTVHRWERKGRLRPSRRDPGGTKYWLAEEVTADLLAPPPEPTPAPLASVSELVEATRRPRRRRSG